MPSPIILPEQYGLVLGVAVSSLFVNALHVMKVVQGRHKYGIKPPAAVAGPEHLKKHPDAAIFDCAMRAHANFNENLPTFLMALCVTGLKYPVASAAAGAVWVVGRIAYLYGYINTGKSGVKARGPGFAVAVYTQLGLMCTAAYSAYTFIF